MVRGNQGFKVEGLRELQREIARLKDAELRAELRALNRGAALEVKQAVNPPVKTGRLRDSLSVRAGLRDAYVKAGGARVPYARPIHWGWPARGIQKNPFLWRAVGKSRPRVVRTYRIGIHRLMQRISARRRTL